VGYCGARLVWGAILWGIATVVHGGAAHAQAFGLDDPRLSDEAGPRGFRFEASAGAQTFVDAWALYTGVTAAPFGSLDRDGVRVRAVGGYGAYRYSGPRAAGVGSRIVAFRGEAAFADLLAGYQAQLGALTLKGFAGVATSEHRMSPDDPETAVRGGGVGARIALETWWTIGERAWTSLDVSWATVHDSYAGRGRVGWRLLPALSAGLEAGAAGNIECDVARVGGFLRYEWAAGEISASAGWSNDKLLDGRDGPGLGETSTPYATVSWLTKF
jgi:Cellulose biosynthesis protein BcsS